MRQVLQGPGPQDRVSLDGRRQARARDLSRPPGGAHPGHARALSAAGHFFSRVDFMTQITSLVRDRRLHVAIIMDGNGRWAKERGLPRLAGHRAGADSVRRAVEASPGLGIGTLTLYAFSADNWRRPRREVVGLMGLLAEYLRREIDLRMRTGGEQRLSDFMLWECAYAELLFTRLMWPDFQVRDLEAAVREFDNRQRRFGGLPERAAS